MITIISLMILGIAVGFLMREFSSRWVSLALTVLIWLLLFFLGVEVGSNPNVLNGIKDLGIEALILAVGASGGSIALAWALWKYIKYKKGEKA